MATLGNRLKRTFDKHNDVNMFSDTAVKKLLHSRHQSDRKRARLMSVDPLEKRNCNALYPSTSKASEWIGDGIRGNKMTKFKILSKSNERKSVYGLPSRMVHTKKSNKLTAPKNSGRWKPTDDLLLIISILQVNDLDIVFAVSKFSCKFTFSEVESRWKKLLYDDLVSRTARAAIRKIHPETEAVIHRRAPFSLGEEELLSDILSTETPTLDDFQQLLKLNSTIFYHSRTSKSLQKHWTLLRKYKLLNDQRTFVEKCSNNNKMPPSFSDAELDIINEKTDELAISANSHIKQELKLMDLQIKRRVRLIEEEHSHWMQLLGIRNTYSSMFDSITFAVWRGKYLHFEMRSRYITFGRLTNDKESLDVNLSTEGPTQKISRHQGSIELLNDGSFVACNCGKRPYFLDGKPVLPGTTSVVNNNSIFEFFGMTLLFLINKDLVKKACYQNC